MKKLFLVFASLFCSVCFSKTIELPLNKQNCSKIDGSTEGYEKAVRDDLKTADYRFIEAEWGSGYGLCNMTVQAKGRLYDCYIEKILSSDGGKTAFAHAGIGTTCTKR
jgi:hypothetical protein